MSWARTETPKYENSHFNRFYHPSKEKHIVKVFPGGVYCSRKTDEIIATGLGSCIAACIWDKESEVGGMNHFLLPFDNKSQLKAWKPEEVVSTASRYGSYAMEMLINALIERGARRSNLQVKLFGGAQMLGRNSMVGEKNIAFILSYVEQEGLNVVAQDLGGLEQEECCLTQSAERLGLSEFHLPKCTTYNIKKKNTPVSWIKRVIAHMTMTWSCSNEKNKSLDCR